MGTEPATAPDTDLSARRRWLLAQLVGAQEEERRRLARDIHDDAVQMMATVALRLELIRRKVGDDRIQDEIEEVAGIARDTVVRLRAILAGLRPPSVEGELVPTLAAIVHRFEDDHDIRASFSSQVASGPSGRCAVAAFRVVQEALRNVARHAEATGVDVVVEEREGGVAVTVRDDGRGFGPDELDMPEPGHLGLRAMREHADAVGGWCWVDSTPGEGTRVSCWVPFAPPEVPEDLSFLSPADA